ncbi:hypothetical protein TVAG_138990 [Trichomonas vaginalis G3]|uniref:EF-hand domain-containing protein n=1 Tax=Trichomonas vaginalis (strain ATCC PRA-98 / G3) TaxID=412133 RepID=A2E473_TRIV3|nr:EF-hand family [Trichomonas vaginalis G3]EAY12519.1 hypothetical protein TVAG_138990 [Trichomonas vaginalis G3]KAI5554056.1 EF-hand family [Trichomonas vaginalis G3]|eukprot:XP_001324742.1 hypothetical protein [Trichomonas vaginalis G3]
MSDESYVEYSQRTQELLKMISNVTSQVLSMKNIEHTIDAYKNCYASLNRISNVELQEISQKNADIINRWNDLVKMNTESAVIIVIDPSLHFRNVTKAITKLNELISSANTEVENFLCGYVNRYNIFVHQVDTELSAAEFTITNPCEGFDRRRQALNDAKRKLMELRQQVEELERSYSDVKRAGKTEHATMTPEQVRAKQQEIFNTIDEKLSELDNEIQLVLNLKITEQKFYELKRVFAQHDLNKSGALESHELAALLNFPKRKNDGAIISALLSEYGNGKSISMIGFLQMMAADAARLLMQDTVIKSVPKGRIFTKGIHHV